MTTIQKSDCFKVFVKTLVFYTVFLSFPATNGNDDLINAWTPKDVDHSSVKDVAKCAARDLISLSNDLYERNFHLHGAQSPFSSGVKYNVTFDNGTTESNTLECALEQNAEPGVKIVTSKRFLELVTPKGNESTCALALFYYPWCTFSAKSSRDFNAIGRLFPQLNVIALNAYLHNSINMRFGLVGVPTILFFHKGKIVAKYNSTESSLLSLVSFINRITGLEPDLTVNLTEEDWTSPLPTVPQQPVDFVLILSSVFLLFTLCYLIGRSSVFKKIIESIRNTWREAEAQHQHLD